MLGLIKKIKNKLQFEHSDFTSRDISEAQFYTKHNEVHPELLAKLKNTQRDAIDPTFSGIPLDSKDLYQLSETSPSGVFSKLVAKMLNSETQIKAGVQSDEAMAQIAEHGLYNPQANVIFRGEYQRYITENREECEALKEVIYSVSSNIYEFEPFNQACKDCFAVIKTNDHLSNLYENTLYTTAVDGLIGMDIANLYIVQAVVLPKLLPVTAFVLYHCLAAHVGNPLAFAQGMKENIILYRKAYGAPIPIVYKSLNSLTLTSPEQFKIEQEAIPMPKTIKLIPVISNLDMEKLLAQEPKISVPDLKGDTGYFIKNGRVMYNKVIQNKTITYSAGIVTVACIAAFSLDFTKKISLNENLKLKGQLGISYDKLRLVVNTLAYNMSLLVSGAASSAVAGGTEGIVLKVRDHKEALTLTFKEFTKFIFELIKYADKK
jgi:hypothetical protein